MFQLRLMRAAGWQLGTAKQFANGHPLPPLGKWRLGKRLHRVFWAVPAKPRIPPPSSQSTKRPISQSSAKKSQLPCQLLDRAGGSRASRGKAKFPGCARGIGHEKLGVLLCGHGVHCQCKKTQSPVHRLTPRTGH